jgi:hypothetical protein
MPFPQHPPERRENVLSGPALLGGLEEPLFAVKTNDDRYMMLLYHLDQEDATSKLFRISLGYTQLELGIGTKLL